MPGWTTRDKIIKTHQEREMKEDGERPTVAEMHSVVHALNRYRATRDPAILRGISGSTLVWASEHLGAEFEQATMGQAILEVSLIEQYIKIIQGRIENAIAQFKVDSVPSTPISPRSVILGR